MSLRRNTRSLSPDEEVKPDLSPMIDCVFILLIFFIVTTVFQKAPGVEVERPQAAFAAELEKNSVLIAITADNKVFYAGEEIGIGGIQNVIRPQLLSDENLSVILQADTNAFRGVVSQVEQQILDAGVKKHLLNDATS
ncbi:MAG: ExbD/TolR family protein [Akkermansiaceae bacterium]